MVPSELTSRPMVAALVLVINVLRFIVLEVCRVPCHGPLQLCSCLAEAAASEDDLSGKPPGFVGREKGRDQPDVFRHAGPTERSQRFHRVCDLLVSVHGTRALGVRYARVDGVHTDVPWSKLLREHA